MQRIIEVLVGIPSLIIVILFLMAFPAGVGTIIAALSITGWVNMARLVRAEILKLKNQEFVLASQVLGTSKFNIIMKDLIPNTVSVIVINVMFTIPSAIFTEAFLSFIGIGLAEPQAFPWCIDQRWLSGTANVSTCTDFPGNCYRTDYGMLQYSGRRTS